MMKIEKVLRDKNGKNLLNDFFEDISIRGDMIIVKKDGLFGHYLLENYQKVLEFVWKKIDPFPYVLLTNKGNGQRRMVFDYEGNFVKE